jgi:colicin import membrane protein
VAAVASPRGSWRPVAWSLVGHLLLFALFAANWSFWRGESSLPVQLAIEAAVVPDVDAMRAREADQRRREEAEQRRQEEDRRAEAQRQAEVARQQEERKRREAAERKRLEAERIAVEKRRAAEEQRQREAEQKRQAEEQRRAEEKKQAELARQREEQARREAEVRRRQQEREAQLAAALAAEQEREDAVRGGLLDQWIEVIRQRVQRNWIRPASARAGLECEVRVAQIPGGEVVDVRVGQCNGDAAVVRSIENAVYRASPLPPPPDAALFERNITLVFKPDD